MPEPILDSLVMVSKNPKNMNKKFFVHHHIWLSIFNNVKMEDPETKIYIPDITECNLFCMPDQPKNEPPIITAIVIHYINYKKDKKGKKSTLYVDFKREVGATNMAQPIRKSMSFYKIDKFRPKTYTLPQIERVSNLMIRNTYSKGVMSKHQANSW